LPVRSESKRPKYWVPDTRLLASVAVLVVIGFLMIYSSAMGEAYLDLIPSPAGMMIRQGLSLLIGLVVGFILYRLGVGFYKTMAFPVYLFSIILLLLVFVPGMGVQAFVSKQWVRIGSFTFQPSELAKLATILIVANFFSVRNVKEINFRQTFSLFLMFGVPLLLIFLEPDMGAVVVMLAIFVVQFFLSGAPVLGLILISGASLGAGTLLLVLGKGSYILDRFSGFLDPISTKLGSGWQLFNSLVAISYGGFFGRGLFNGQMKFTNNLPEMSNDFIFSLVTEELGGLGAIVVLLAFVVFIFSAIKIAARTRNMFSYLVALGIAVHIGFQAFVNTAVVVGLLPTTGLVLPFISSGGSSLIVSLAEVGILLGIDRASWKERNLELKNG
jgi:cell division protein FtsW